MQDPCCGAVLSIMFCLGALWCPGCGSGDTDRAREVVVYTSVDQVFSEPIFKHCEKMVGLEVRAVFDTEETKSTGVLNRLVAEADRPQADVFWSGDPVRPFLLMENKQVEPYSSETTRGMPEAFRAGDGTWTGFAARARVLLVNTQKVSADKMPGSIRDLADKQWRGQTAIANPLFGTTTMHVAALFARWGDGEAKSFLNALKDNMVRVASSNGEVKRLVTTGEVAFGLTDTDDAHQAVLSGAPVTIVYPDQDDLGTLFMPTSAVLISGGPNTPAGRALIDCLLSPQVEEQMASNGAHMPLRDGVETPTGLRRASELRAMNVDYRKVADEMKRLQPWIREWVGL